MIQHNPAQLELLDTHLPRRPYCTDDLQSGLQIRDAGTAKTRRYIQVNPPWLRAFIVLDVDRPGGGIAWMDVMPAPAWSSVNMKNGHAHIAWALDAPVLLGQHDRQKPMRFLAAIEGAATTALEADPAYSGLITKNPLHSHWRTYTSWHSRPWTLDELAQHLDLKRHAPRTKPERVGLGRNVDAFDFLRHYAYREIRGWKRANGPGAFVYWQKHLYDRTLDYTGLEHPNPLDFRECHHIAKSVARWVWTHFDVEASDSRFQAIQSARGRKSGQKRREASESLRASARLMRIKGMSVRAIADEIGVGKSTVSRWVSHEP